MYSRIVPSFESFLSLNSRLVRLSAKPSPLLSRRLLLFSRRFSNSLIEAMYINCKRNSRLFERYNKIRVTSNFCSGENEDELFNLSSDPELESTLDILPRSFRVAGMPHQVLVVQPSIKWGPDKKRLTTPELQLEEAVSLVNTLSGWRVLDSRTISLTSFDKKSFFSKGQLETLKEYVRRNQSISAVFVNIKSLKSHQHVLLESELKVPIFDRYNVIINIFKQHAKTKESKLQVALAEIPFILSKIKGVESDSPKMPVVGSLGGYLGKRLELLSAREQKIKQALQKLRKNRALLRNKRQSLGIPTIAVVGYTNAGKTSIIKALTGAKKLTPEDKLFATLDVTVHEGHLPRNLKVLLVDTIGFIADIPLQLLEPFIATLEDAIQADVILVVHDVSHPDRESQLSHVMSTLKNLNLDKSLIKNIITVGNKCDKITQEEQKNLNKDHLVVSCLQNTNLDILQDKLEDAVISAAGLLKLTFRIVSGSLEFTWLFKESAVYHIDVDPKNQQYCFVSVLISKVNLEQFKKQFIANKQSGSG